MNQKITTYTTDNSLDDMFEGLQQQGACIVEGIVDVDLMNEIQQEVQPYIDQYQKEQKPNPNDPHDNITRVGAVLNKTQKVMPILAHPLAVHINNHFLLPACSSWQLSSLQVIEVGPGSDWGWMHRDDVSWPMPGERPTMVINFLYPLTPVNEQNGHTKVALGSHKWPRDVSKIAPGELTLDHDAEIDQNSLVGATMDVGSVLVLLGETIHCSGPNLTTDQHRQVLAVSYCLGWLKQEENFVCSLPAKVLHHLPDDVAEILLECQHDPILGYSHLDC